MPEPGHRPSRPGDTVRFSARPRPPAELRGLSITVMGLGLFGGGVGLTRFLCDAGARVVVTDLRDANTLAPSLAELDGLPVRLVLGEHREKDFLDADIVCVNPAVPRDLPLLWRCLERGVELETEMNLFFKLCRAHICGVTGSNGKTTTTRLVHAMVGATQPRTRVGGNLGGSLLDQIDDLGNDDWVVLELSSFQLEDLAALDRRPDVALVTNVSPNHLNRHGTYERYLEAKRTILEGAGDAVLFAEDPVLRRWARETSRHVVYYGRSGDVQPRAEGVWVDGDGVVRHGRSGDSTPLFDAGDLHLAGRFNLVNAAGAAAAALRCGCPTDSLRAAVAAFQPIEHRLELVAEIDGVRYWDDSIATTPESTLRAIEALGPDVVLILGGSDKGSAFGELGRAVARRARGAVVLGATADRIEAAIRRADPAARTLRAGSLEEAVVRARQLARRGDSIALSPACASLDMFTHFAERGRRFRELVRSLS